MNSKLRIIVTGLIAQHPTLGGVTWDYLQYALGLARLGHDVYYLEDTGEWPYRPDGTQGRAAMATDCAYNVDYLAKIMARFDLADKWSYRFPFNSSWFGLADKDRREAIASADLLLNVSGTGERPEDFRRARRLAFIDTDPVFTQIRLACDVASERDAPRLNGRVRKPKALEGNGDEHSKAAVDSGPASARMASARVLPHDGRCRLLAACGRS